MAKREYQTYKIIKIRLKVLLKFAPLKLALRKRGFSPIKIDFSSYKAKKKNGCKHYGGNVVVAVGVQQ